MSRPSKLAGKVTVVTGAGSGIGRAVALGLARRGARLAISDVNETGLAETTEQVKATGAEFHSATLNVVDRAAVKAYATTVREHYGVVHQIYNNAGVAGERDLLDPGNYANLQRIIDVNLWGVINGTVEFLPHLIASGDGHLVNVSSLNGLVATPLQAGYCASKFGVRGFTEGVYCDILFDQHPVKVTVVYPAGIATNIATSGLRDAVGATEKDQERARILNEKFLTMDVNQAASIILKGVEKKKPRVRVGMQAVLLDAFVRAVPSRYLDLLARPSRRMFAPTVG
ncbi:SDR family NAD(P)-dependent oxidoreductase [Streptomyces sp. NPDC046909]|uniref:SDR family NAD(P)-dependent oxidoreductase n=1 Tax=Streptomyces sp. NPDC046909 TaxID=3155617 RepID=UPI0033F938AF